MRRAAWSLLLAEAVTAIVLASPAKAGGVPYRAHLHFNPDATLDPSQVVDLTTPQP